MTNQALERARAGEEDAFRAIRRRPEGLQQMTEMPEPTRYGEATGDIDGVVAILTDDAWLTMPPEPYEYQGPAAIGTFLRDRTIRRGAPILVPTRANTQPAFGVYFPPPETDTARLYAMLVLTLEGHQISAVTWFGGNSGFPTSDCHGYSGCAPPRPRARRAP